ncbi:MAG: ammonium transporter, Amt family, partial [Actinomycetota bacterium]|nr:ammonium transporter, Amt family [Actinomycetota bacterium]
FVTLIIALVIKYTMGLRVTEEEEITGIDQTVHAESAYEFAGLGSASAGTISGAHVAPEQVKVHS